MKQSIFDEKFSVKELIGYALGASYVVLTLCYVYNQSVQIELMKSSFENIQQELDNYLSFCFT